MQPNRSVSFLLIALCLTFCSLLSPASAQGDGGGGTVIITFATGPLSNVTPLFNGAVPAGQFHYSYTPITKGVSSKTLLIEVSNINLADGDTLDVEVDQAQSAGKLVEHSYLWLPVTIQHGSGSLSWSTANGDVVPFLLPNLGTTTISIWGNYTVLPGTFELATGVEMLSGSFGVLR